MEACANSSQILRSTGSWRRGVNGNYSQWDAAPTDRAYAGMLRLWDGPANRAGPRQSAGPLSRATAYRGRIDYSKTRAAVIG